MNKRIDKNIDRTPKRGPQVTQTPASIVPGTSTAPNVTPPSLSSPDAFVPSSATAPSFTSGIAPAVRPAIGYTFTLANTQAWFEVALAADARTGGPSIPALVEAGKPFEVRYGRSPADLGDGGALAKAIMHWRIDGGPVRSSVLVDGSRDRISGELVRLPGRIDLPVDARGALEIWFEQQTTDGRTLWDSAFGQNYRARIVPSGGSTLRFDEAWDEAQSDVVRAGEAVRIAYDVDRMLGRLAGTQHHGVPTWSVSAFVSFDGGPAQELPLVVPRHGAQGGTVELLPFEACTVVPDGARQMSVWFRGTSYAGAHDNIGGPAWDSDFGRNYTFTVET